MKRRSFVSAIIAAFASSKSGEAKAKDKVLYDPESITGYPVLEAKTKITQYITICTTDDIVIGKVSSLSITETYHNKKTEITGELHSVMFNKQQMNKIFVLPHGDSSFELMMAVNYIDCPVKELKSQRWPVKIITKTTLPTGKIITDTINNVWFTVNKGIMYSALNDYIIIQDHGPSSPQPAGGLFFTAESITKCTIQ